MVCCFLCSDAPIEGDERAGFPNTFAVNMMGACCAEPLWCLCQFVPFTACCTQIALRHKVLGGNMDDYICCQGYLCASGCCCFKPGSMGEKSCPDFCLCLEACLCNGFAVSASRLTIMDRYQLHADPMDNRLIRCNNFLQILSCICDVLAIFIADLREVARILDCIAQCFYYCVSGCMTAQTRHEIRVRQENVGSVQVAVPAEKMVR